MKRSLTYALALGACLAWGSAEAQILPVYDGFEAGYIDPAKWIAPPMCSANGYDCAREVRNNHLRLAVRGYGSPDVDGGASFDVSQLLFRNPDTIETIRLRFKVRAFSSATCPTNSEAAHPQLLVHGTFFNSGGGDPTDDVTAYLMVERRTDDVSPPPTSLRVGGFMSTRGGFFNNVDLGTVEIGEAAIATLKWEPANHAFVVRVVKTVTTPSIVEATMPYSQSDSTPPAQPFKSLQVGSFAPNCTTARSFAAMDASIDNVRLNSSAVP